MKSIKLEIMPKAAAERVAGIMGPSSAAAAALRALSVMGSDADNFEICRDPKTNTLLLIGKEFIERPELDIQSPDSGEG